MPNFRNFWEPVGQGRRFGEGPDRKLGKTLRKFRRFRGKEKNKFLKLVSLWPFLVLLSADQDFSIWFEEDKECHTCLS